MIGRTVSHYRILSDLGQGGFGAVYLAEDTHLSRRVAVKFLTANPENTQFRARFLREARAASALNHPNIAGIYDYGETAEGQPFIVMELVTGVDLHRLIRRDGLSIERVVSVIMGVAEALADAHRHGVLHRDIKPANIVVGETGEVKVLDFGLAKQIESPALESGSGDAPMLTSDTIEGQVLGTPAYMSPEQVRDEPLGPPSDIFALGSVMYECLTGRAPFAGKNQVDVLASVLHVEPAPPSRRNPRVPPRIDAIVLKLLAKDRAVRYQSADELLIDLRTFQSTLVAAETQETLVLPSATAGATPLTMTSFGAMLSRTLTTLTPLNRSRLGAAVLLVAVAAGALWTFLPGGTYKPAPAAVRWYQEGVSALRDGTYYKASQALQRAVALDGNFSMAHARLAEAWLELEYGDKAKEEMLRAVPPGSKPRLTRDEQDYEQAIGATLTGDLASAIQKYRDIVDRVPDAEKANAWLDLGRAYERKADPKSALAAYREAVKRQPQNPAVQLRLGAQYSRQLDQTRATQAFRDSESIYRGLSNFEGMAEVQYQTGMLANRVGKPVEARALLSQAIEMSQHIGSVSQEILALIQLSFVDQHQNNMSQAEADASRAIDLARTNGLETLTMRGLIDLGNTYFLKGELEPARRHFSQSLEIARRYHAERPEARALLSLGSLEVQAGELDTGMQLVRQALTWYEKHSSPTESIQALTLIARTQRQKGDYPGALDSFRQQLDVSRQFGLQTQMAQAAQGIGSVLMAQGRWPEALASYREEFDASGHAGAEINTQYSLMDLAGVYWRLGRYAEAEQSLDRIGSKASAVVAAEANQIRADTLLSRRQFAPSAALYRKILAEGGFNNNDRIAELKLALSRALLGSGARKEADEVMAQVDAAKITNPRLIAERGLAKADALAPHSYPGEASSYARAAAQFFEKAENLERQWHCLLAVARLSNSRQDAQKAADAFAQLQQKWDAENYASYARRPDIQFDRAQLQKLLGRN